jgi:hypothetical protein
MSDEQSTAPPPVPSALASAVLAGPPKPAGPELPARLAGASLVLELPKSLAERWDVVLAGRGGQPSHRVLAAALGLSVGRMRRFVQYTGNVLEFGGRILDLLLKAEPEPATLHEVIQAGRVAFRRIDESLIDFERVEIERRRLASSGIDRIQLEIERAWGKEPGWLATLPPELQERLIAEHRNRAEGPPKG